MKSFLLASLFSFCALTTFAQYDEEYDEDDDKPVRAGVYFTAGINYAGVMGWEDPATAGAGRLAGFNGGMTFFGALSKRGYSQITISANFSQQGFLSTEAVNDADNHKMFVNYITFPVIYRYRPFKKFDAMYLGVGPQYGLKVGGHIRNKAGEKFELNDDAFNKDTWTGVGVLGFNFGNYANWGIEFGYHHDFTDFMKAFPEHRHSVLSAKLILPVDFVTMVAGAMQ